MNTKAVLIVFLLFLLLFVLFTQLPKTGEFVQTGGKSNNSNSTQTQSSSTKWKFVGRIQVENGKIVSVNFTNR